MDRITFTIREVQDLTTESEPDNLIRVYTIHVSPEETEETGKSDLAREIQSILYANDAGWRCTLTDTRGWTEAGASGSAEDIVLTIVTAILSGTAPLVAQQLITWASKKRHKGSEFDFTSIDPDLNHIKYLVTQHFNPQGTLEVMKISKLTDAYSIELTDGQGTQYKAGVGKTGAITVEKVAPPIGNAGSAP